MDSTRRVSRVTIDDPVYRLVTEQAAARNVSLEDLVESCLVATFAEEEQALPARAFLTRTAKPLATRTQADVAAALQAAMPWLRTVGIRLGAPTHERMTSPFPRTRYGADYGEAPSKQLWTSVRGMWVIGTESNAIAAYRGGEPLAFFVDVAWSDRDLQTGRRWATHGLRVTEQGVCVNPDTGEHVRAATAEEQEARSVVFGCRLWMPPAARNPVVRLWT